ncbi:MAG: hypothetical protein U0996_04160 [Planctomycetaceae bacterium]
MEPMTARSQNMLIPWKVRADLELIQRGGHEWVARDPVALASTLLSDVECFALSQLSGRLTSGELLRRVRQRSGDASITEQDIDDLVMQFRLQQLVQPAFAGMTQSSVAMVLPGPFRRFSRAAAKLVRFQMPLLDPSPWLNRIAPKLQHPAVRMTASICMMVSFGVLLVLVSRLGSFVSSLPSPTEFFGPSNALLLLAAFVSVKLLHEAGHMLMASYYRVECHEAGFMFLLFTPVMYTDVSDASRLPSRQRAAVAAAGIVVELMIASLAFLIWMFAAPGIIRSLMANVVCICTVGTVLFNGNPLLRYDGYFVLSDLTSISNLGELAGTRVRQILEWCFTGVASTEQRFRRLSPLQKGLVTAWGFSSILWRILMALALLQWLPALFESWGFRSAGSILALMLVVPISIPVINTALSIVAITVRDRRSSGIRALVVTIMLLIALCLPLPSSVVVPATIEPDGAPLYLTVAGQFKSGIPYGTQAAPSTVVARFASPELLRQRIRLEGEVRELTAILRAMELQSDDRTLLALPATRESLQNSLARLEDLNRELARLTVTTTVGGTVIPPRPKVTNSDEESLPGWSRVPISQVNTGAMMEEGTAVGIVADSPTARLRLAVAERQLQDLKEGEPLEFWLYGSEEDPLPGKLLNLSAMPSREPHAELIAEGLIPPYENGTDALSRYQAIAEVKLPDEGRARGYYQTGLVRIRTPSSSLLSRGLRLLRETFL